MAKNDDKTPEADKTVIEPTPKVDEKAHKDGDAVAAKPVAKETTKVEKKAESTEGLVKMHKDGADIHVHPTTVEAHKKAHWKVA